jgi:hypothetical protein
MPKRLAVHFSDYFAIPPSTLSDYGTIDVSLLGDLPLFIDPFLLFSSDKQEYVNLHKKIIDYLVFLKDKSQGGAIRPGLLRAWFTFPEVKENWFGYSLSGNQGRGLGAKFASSLNSSYQGILRNFGNETLLQSSHLEKIGLIRSGVGKDNISDFTTNLIKEYLLEYTQAFAKKHLKAEQVREFSIEKVYFNYKTESWTPKRYILPAFGDNYIILTPMDILTLDEIWINRNDLNTRIPSIIHSLSNIELRDQLNNYILRTLSIENKKQREKALNKVIGDILNDHPEILDLYIKIKEDSQEEAKNDSATKVQFVQSLLIEQVKSLIDVLDKDTSFYSNSGETYPRAYERVMFLKDVIENKGGWRNFYVSRKPINKEENLQIMYRLTWFASSLDVNREVNNGTGPVDFSISNGAHDKTLVEFKLASNSKLRKNLENQTASYEKAGNTETSIKAILYFDDLQQDKVNKILKDLNLSKDRNIILIDASPKESASNI